jgi:hypothetical protein
VARRVGVALEVVLVQLVREVGGRVVLDDGRGGGRARGGGHGVD